jgi:hypothetical protein
MRSSFWDLLPFRPWRILDVVESADEVPDQLPTRGMVLVGSNRHPKWLCFDCPCESRHRIMLNLDPARRPSWTVRGSRGRDLSISPSVDYIEGRKRCHYFMRAGRVQWVEDSRR